MTFFRSEMLYGKFLILLALTALFIFLLCSESSGGEAEDEYPGVYVVSACKNFDSATALVNKLKAQGYNPFYKTVNIPNKKKGLRVFVRMYKSKREALFAGKELREKGVMKSFIIVKTEPGNKRYAPPPPPVLVAKSEMDSPKTEEVALPHKADEGAEDEYPGVYVVSACKNFDNATALVNKLKAQGYNPFCKTVNIPNKKKGLRVFVRMYKSKREALFAGKELREKGVMKSFIIVKTEPENKRYTPPPPPVLVAKSEMDSPKTEEVALPHKADEQVAPPHKADKIKFYKIKIKKVKDKEAVPPHKTDEQAVPPHKTANIVKVDGKPYDSAMSDFASGRYKGALSKFKKMAESGKNETALRRMADCCWFLGKKKGDKRYFSEAVDRYRNIIRNYPGLKKENAQAIYRLAGSYISLNLYHEALVEFKNLYSKYPESDYFPESLYMMGEMYYRTKNFNEGIRKFKEYIKRFPDGKHVRGAYFGVGDCFSLMRQFNDADVWYGKALKRWPNLEDIPEDTLSNLGSHYFKAGKYDDALRVFFVYMSIFPDGKHSRDALHAIARSFEETGQLRSALKALSLMVERYPGSREAQKSALIMANIGVKYPEIKLPAHIFPGMDYYGAPIETYDKMAGKLFDLDMEEELLLRKGDALIKKRRYREAFDNCCFLLDRFPYGAHRKAGEKNLILSARHLISDYYLKKDYLAVSDVYFNSDRKVLFGSGDFDMLFRIGNSLKEMGVSEYAAGFFEEMINLFRKDKRINKLSLAMAEIDYARGRYEDVKERLKKLLGEQLGADKKTAMTARELMGDICSKEGLFKEASGFYSKVLSSGAGVEDQMSDVRCQMSDVRKKYADSLRGMGLYSSALINYKRVLKNCGNDMQECSASVIMGSYEGAGDCLYNKGKRRQAILMYEHYLNSSASEDEQKMWTMLNIGREYANLGDNSMAEKSFISLKEKSGDGFWSRVADYYTADKDWTEKYGEYVGD